MTIRCLTGVSRLICLAALIVFPLRVYGNILTGGVERYDPKVDYFPHTTQLQHATGFSVSYHKHYKVVTLLNPWRNSGRTFTYILVQRGTPIPKGFESAQIMRVPVRTVVTMATTFLPYLESLGLVDRLVGHSTFSWVNNPAVLQRIKQGKLAEVGDRATVNVEVLLNLDPELIMAHAIGESNQDSHPRLLDAGLNVVLNAAYMDTTPLGRTEWIKYMALFFNQEEAAATQFDEVVGEYQRLAQLTQSTVSKPSVLVGTSYQGTWYLPGGNSYMARFLRDAGARYIWADDDSTGSLRLDLEAVFERASDADFWLANTSTWKQLQDALAADDRYANFAAVQRGRVYNNNARSNVAGGNDFWETGLANPHKLLADFIAIFHPQLLPHHKLIWYRLLTQ